MRAIQYRRFGGPDELEAVEVEAPSARPGTVRIRVRVAGVNPADRKMLSGALSGGKPLAAPAGIGFEAAGTVDEIGEGVTGVELGDEVFGFGRATIAEQAILDSWVPRPAHLDVEEAAATPAAVETALRMLDAVAVREGDTVVISGAAGGVGTAAIQLARARGAIVIGTAGEGNQGYLEALGALPTTYADGWADRVRELAVAEVDAALDVAGAGVIPQLIALTGDPARVVSIADPTAPDHGAAFTTRAGDRTAALRQAVRLAEVGALRMIVEQRFAFEDATAAIVATSSGHARGKTVVLIG